MVFYSIRAENDLDDILSGMLNWKRVTLSYEHVSNYVLDIIEICESLDQPGFHFDTKYRIHKQFGKKIFPYRRNKNTTWYIIYDYDKIHNIVYIQHIMPNHTTTMDGKSE
jgi:hypothetical protein